MEKEQEILDRLIDIEKSIEFVENKFTVKRTFWMGVIRGVGTVVGAIALVIFGGWFLRTIGVIPGLQEISDIILNAAEKTSLQ